MYKLKFHSRNDVKSNNELLLLNGKSSGKGPLTFMGVVW